VFIDGTGQQFSSGTLISQLYKAYNAPVVSKMYLTVPTLTTYDADQVFKMAKDWATQIDARILKFKQYGHSNAIDFFGLSRGAVLSILTSWLVKKNIPVRFMCLIDPVHTQLAPVNKIVNGSLIASSKIIPSNFQNAAVYLALQPTGLDNVSLGISSNQVSLLGILSGVPFGGDLARNTANVLVSYALSSFTPEVASGKTNFDVTKVNLNHVDISFDDGVKDQIVNAGKKIKGFPGFSF
jgi:hypothetical protein